GRRCSLEEAHALVRAPPETRLCVAPSMYVPTIAGERPWRRECFSRVPPHPSITAFFPCYNDAGTIASIVITADRTLRQLTDDYEIIVGNDASTDNSREILCELEQIYPRLRVLDHPTNRGYGGNLRSLFAASTKDLIFYTD